jgi:integrase/recombinase XerC
MFLGLRNKAIILAFVETGIRLSELIRTQIDDVDFDHSIIRIMGKGARERVVQLIQRQDTRVYP